MKLCMYLGYLLIAAIFIGPIVFLFVSSLKPYAQIESDMSNIRAFIPYGDLSLDNYINVIVKADFFKFFKNDVSVLVENKIASAHSEVIFVFVFLTAGNHNQCNDRICTGNA